ncbi:kinase-like domain-containing protein, partial [Baffinella frigidus]
DNFEFDQDKEDALLGEGSFGKTYRMKSTVDGQVYAVKMINVLKSQRDGTSVQTLKREVHNLLQLNSPFVVRYYTCFMRKKYFCIVMEIARGGTASKLIKDKTIVLTEERIRSVMKQMVTGLEHIHSRKMLHRDLKLENILLAGDGEIRISDFGLACLENSAQARGRAGTITHASPEKAAAKPYDSKDDMWAVGCMMAELITG